MNGKEYDKYLFYGAGAHSAESDGPDSECMSSSSQMSNGREEVLTHQSMTIVDGKFFKILPESCNSNTIVALCKKCEPQQKIIRGKKNVSSNFLLHLKRKHGETAIQEFNDYVMAKKLEETKNTASAKRAKFSRTEIKLTQEQFETKISQFVIHSMIPFRSIEDKYLIEIFQSLGIQNYNIQVPSRRKVVQKCMQLFKDNNEKIRSVLRDTEYACTTADIWSGKKRSFLGVTVHWITSNYERESAVLACRRFHKSHSHDRIANLLAEIHSEFDLNVEKVKATVTDNGSNFIKAFELFGIQSDVIEIWNDSNHFPNDGEAVENFEEDKISDSDGEISQAEPEKTGLEFSISSTYFPEEIEHLIPCHIRCCSHTINLCTTSDVNRALLQLPELAEIHKTVISKCNFLWKLASRPKSAEVLQELLGHTLSRPGVTRWNSLYDSLKQILKIQDKCPQLYRHFKIKQQLTENDFLYITEYVKCSAPLAELLDILQGEKNIFFGIVLPSIVALKKKLQKLVQNPWIYCKPLIEIYISSVDTRFSEYLNVDTHIAETAAIAALSNPFFKKQWLPGIDEENQQKILKLFKSAVMKKIPRQAKKLSESKQKVVAVPARYLSYFDFGDNEANSELFSSNEIKIKAERQICNYFTERSVNLSILDDYPAIKKVFFESNTPLPSSAPVERLFSFATITNSPKANRLSDQNFEMRVVLKANAFRFN